MHTTMAPSSLVTLAVLFLAAPALAQDPVLLEARSSLSTYEVGEGGRTLRSLRDLGPLAGRGDAEARYMRAFAGAEVLVAATVLGDDGIRARLANVLGVAEAELGTHLEGELGAATGTYRAGALSARELLTMAREWQGDPARLFARRGPHRDALFVLAVASASDRALLAPEPCAGRARDPVVCGWDEHGRREAAAIREAMLAARRAARARSDGDPLLGLVGPRLEAAVATLAALELHPAVEMPEAMGIATAPDTAPSAALDALVVVAEAGCHLRVMPVVRVGADGTFSAVRGEGGGVEIDLPGELPAVPQAIDALVSAAAGLGLPSGARVGVAPAETVPAHVVTRAVLSLVHAGLTPSHLVGAREDESLAAVPITVTRSGALLSVGARVRVQMGAYGFARGVRGRESRIPRVRTDAGLVFDEAGLRSRLDGGSFTTVSLDAMATVPGVELLRAAFVIATDARSIVYVTP
jgi:hypothetical protein